MGRKTGLLYVPLDTCEIDITTEIWRTSCSLSLLRTAVLLPFLALAGSFDFLLPRTQARKYNYVCPIVGPKRARSASTRETCFSDPGKRRLQARPISHRQECWVLNQLGASSPSHVYTVMLCKLESLFPGTSGRTSWTRVSLLINLGS